MTQGAPEGHTLPSVWVGTHGNTEAQTATRYDFFFLTKSTGVKVSMTSKIFLIEIISYLDLCWQQNHWKQNRGIDLWSDVITYIARKKYHYNDLKVIL